MRKAILVGLNIFLAIVLAFALSACSFAHEQTPETLRQTAPDMIFYNAELQRYENKTLSLQAQVDYAELYSEDAVWAGKKIQFERYDKNKQAQASGSAGSFYVDEKTQEFFLNDSVDCFLADEEIRIEAQALFWDKAEHILSAPKNSEVRLKKEAQFEIVGKDFCANTLTQSVQFLEQTHGSIQTEQKENTRAEQN